MKNVMMMVVSATLSGAGLPALAAGFVSLPERGFATEGGNSAYTLCHAAANFGATAAMQAQPGANDRCAVFVSSEMAAPLPGFDLLAVGNRPVVMNSELTGGMDKKVGNVTDFVWRNAEKTACIYGTKVVATLGDEADYNAALPGRQYLIISDLTRGGFDGRPVEAAYASVSAVAKPLYRVGRTFTAVQYRGKRTAAVPGYLALPPIAPEGSPAIKGVDAAAASVPVLAQQSAALDGNWVTFTSAVTALDDKRRTSAASSMFYVKTTCTDEAPEVVPGAIRLRQTIAPFIEISVPGFVPPDGKVPVSSFGAS